MPAVERSAPRRYRSLIGRTAAVLASLLALPLSTAGPVTTFAQDGTIELGLRPIDPAGEFFELTLAPGETRTLQVELANFGDVGISARTYAADVYTIVNGGFGARLRDEPHTGATLWLDYAGEVVQLEPGQGIQRSFTVTVPTDAEAGEYISSLILENEEPIRGTGEVALDQVIRQATAVVVTVPGPRTAALRIGAASHKVVADKSVVAVEVDNPGNVRLRPVAQFALFDAAGSEVSRATVPMDSFYARTSTLVEIPLAALLRPGSYTVNLSLDDVEHDVRVEQLAIPLLIGAPPEPASPEGQPPGLTEVIQAVQEASPAVVIAALVAGILGAVVVGWFIVRRRRTQ